MTLFDLGSPGLQGKKAAGDKEEPSSKSAMPLAARMRPRNFNEYVGQQHIIGEGKVLRKAIESDQLPSIILWGPPGSGKTTLAQVIANVSSSYYVHMSAVTAGVADLRRVVDEARRRRKETGQRTILFIDEIHRFNKGQQDAVLPFVEDGEVTFVGATTENPSFEVISALLSRSRVFTLNALTDDEIRTIVERALIDKENGLGNINVEITPEALQQLVTLSNGDARVALNAVEMAALAVKPGEDGVRHIGLNDVEESMQKRALLYDKAGDQHYDLISALHKTLRGSDPDAALYWMGRMLEAGEDPLYIMRRLIRFASEDVGMADPQALVVAVAAQQAVHFVGMPECNLALAQTVVYLATAPKSNSLYTAYKDVQQDVERTRNDPVPLHLRNAPTRLMKNLGYGKGYKYAHNFEGHFVEQQNLPESMKNKRYYFPSDQGFEKTIVARLKAWWGERMEGKK
jgi:putative ATPase